MNITSDQIRDLSVKAVEEFLNNKVPLSVGLAKQASAAELNSEQIHRAVEATNSIAYLKILSLSDDRTVEFSLAKYAEVMTHVAIPSIEKVASAGQESTGNCVTQEPEYTGPEFQTNEKLVHFIKEAAVNKQALETLELESINVTERLIKSAAEIKKDSAWMDKLASVTSPEEFGPLAVLVSGEKQEYRTLKDLGLFKEAQLSQVCQFSELYKQARQIVREMAERSELQKRADEINRAQRAMFRNPLNTAAGSVAKGLGRAVGTVAAAPGKALGAGVRGVKNSIKTKVNQMSGGAKPTVGQVGKATTSTLGSVAKGVGFAGGAAFDAAMYNPGKDSSTGRSNDVWDALQRD
ncbi:hypothetical protein D3C87_280010 [compost metagenome]